MNEKVFTEREVKEILVRAMCEKDDHTYYDYDDNLIVDEEYYGWSRAVNFIQDQFGIKFEEDEALEIEMELFG